MRKQLLCIGCVLICLMSLAAAISLAAIPHRINYQGRLVDSVTGEPRPGAHTMKFRIYDVANLGTHLWSEEQAVTADTTGVVAAILGSVTPIDIAFDGRLWLEIEVNTEILEPRRELVSAPYAFHSMDSDSLGGLHSDSYSLVGHTHDDRYYTETELSTSDGSDPNTGLNAVHWNNLNGVPAGFADGVDDGGGGAGDGHSLDADDGTPENVVYVNASGYTGVGTTQAERLLHVYDGSAGTVTSVDAAELVIEDDGNARINMLTPSNKSAGIDFGDPADANAGWLTYDHTTDKMKLGVGNADRVTVESDGDVGIGTTSPAEKLHVAGNVRLDAGGDVEFGDTNTEIYEASDDLYVTADDDLYLQPDDDVYVRADGGADWIRFDTGTKRVGINETSPSSDLDIEVPAAEWSEIVELGSDATDYRLFLGSGTNWASISGGTTNRDDLTIQHSTGNIGIGTFSPSAPLDVVGDVEVTGNTSMTGNVDVTGVLVAMTSASTGQKTGWFNNSNTTGTGLWVSGEGQGVTYYTDGQGLACAGYDIGAHIRANRADNGEQKAIHAYIGTTNYTYICYRRSGGAQYDVFGDGGVALVMPTSKGNRTLVSSVSPEPWIDDYGSGEIIDGVGHVDLDPLYLECVAVKAAHPLKVFIELTSPLVNQYYISKGTTGFDVLVAGEDAKNANATFDYRVVAKRTGRESLRFEQAEMLPEAKEMSQIEPVIAPVVEPVQMGNE
ncbi:MAG: hypothetical protein ABIJ00_04435 [Candidatus Eisenbacteria bacterium]